MVVALPWMKSNIIGTQWLNVDVHDDKNGLWVRKLANIFCGTWRVAVEFGDAIAIYDVKRMVIHRYPEEESFTGIHGARRHAKVF
jgi:hypothetical protein